MQSPRFKKLSFLSFDFLLLSCGGLGKAKWAPGTVASAATAIIIYFCPLSAFFYLFSTLVIATLSLWRLSQPSNSPLAQTDPSWIVIDEFLGMFLGAGIMVLFKLPLNLTTILILLAAFRFFDITKIFPANLFDNKKNALGVIGDDLVSGIYAAIFCQLIHYFLHM